MENKIRFQLLTISDLINITIGHYDAAIEHITNNPTLNHKPTMLQAARLTLRDLLRNKTIYDRATGSYLVYEVVTVPTLGTRSALVIRQYVPVKYRGQGIMSKLLDCIPEREVISGKGCYGEVGRLYLSRANL